MSANFMRIDGSFVANGAAKEVSGEKVGFFPRRVELISDRGRILWFESMGEECRFFDAAGAQKIQPTVIAAGDDPSDLTIVPRVSGISLVVTVAGNNTSFSHSYASTGEGEGTITVNSATDGGGVATTTVANLRDLLLGSYGWAIRSAVAETGTDLVQAVTETELTFVPEPGTDWITQAATGFILSADNPLNVDGDAVYYFVTG